MFSKFSKPLLVNFLLLAFLLGANWESVANPKFQRFFYKPRTGMGIPLSSIGGTTRSASCTTNCPIALVPSDSIPLTIAERPSFFFFIPKMTEKISEGKAKFQLFDRSERVYQTTYDLTETGGIVQFKLPVDAPALEVGKNYQWRVVILNSGQSNELTGFVRRVNLTDNKVSNQPKLTAETYAQEGIWQDLLKTLADTKSPEAITQMQEVLKSGKFEAIATQSLLECCKPNN
jgi:hypothetical protein